MSVIPRFSETLPSFLAGADVGVATGVINQAVAYAPGDAGLLAFLASLNGSLTAAEAVTAAKTWGVAGGSTAGYAGPLVIVFLNYETTSSAYWQAGATAADALTGHHTLTETARAQAEQIGAWQRSQGIAGS